MIERYAKKLITSEQQDSKISSLLPSWIREYPDLDSFWEFIKFKYGTYHERRTFITEQFSEARNYLEFGEKPAPKEQSHRWQVNPQPVNITMKGGKFEAQPKKNKVFIVHGRDNESKQEVARFIENVGLEPIILHEQASGGKTIIEKIEHYSAEACFAIVLYTACDHGRGIHETKIPPKQRARQNVVFEHGYLMAKLGRENVCALVKGEIETPNDISGVVYISFDTAGAWKIEISKELKLRDLLLKPLI